MLAYPTEKEKDRKEARHPTPYSNVHAYKPVSKGGSSRGGSIRFESSPEEDDSDDELLKHVHKHEDDGDSSDGGDRVDGKSPKKKRPEPVKKHTTFHVPFHSPFRSRTKTGVEKDDDSESDDDR